MASAERTHSRAFGSIGNKMLAALVVVAVLPSVTVAIYSLRRGSNALADQGLNYLLEAAMVDAGRAQGLIDEFEKDLKKIADEFRKELSDPLVPPEFRRVTLEQRSRGVGNGLNLLGERLRALARQYPALTSAVFRVNSSLIESQRAAGAPARPDVITLLRMDRSAVGPELRSRVRLRPDGEMELTSSIEKPIDERIRRAHETPNEDAAGRPVARTTLPGPDEATDALEIFSLLFRNTDGRLVGRLQATLSWREILRSFREQSGSGESEYTATLYDQGLRRITGSSANLPTVVPLEMQPSMAAGDAGATLTKDGRIVTFAPFRWLSDRGRLFYIIAFSRPATSVRDSVARLRAVFAAILVSALLLTLALGTYVSRHLTRPLRAVRDGARSIASGDLEQQLHVDTGDEVEDLANEFNSMASELRRVYRGMEETIEQRTLQLQTALSDLQATHQRMVESEARYSDIVENALDMIQVTDREGRLLSVNRREADLLQRTPAELVGGDFFEWVAPDARESTRQAFELVLQGETLPSFLSALQIGGGEEVNVEISATPVQGEGRIEGVRAILRDVSERKQLEAQLIKAERLSSVGALAAGVAHEINNPLGIITMFAQRVLEQARRGTIDEKKLSTIVEQARRVASITQGLLDFSRSAPTEYQSFRIQDVVQSSADLVRDRARKRGIVLEVIEEAALPEARGNPQQIGQVLLNLLLNAIHAVDSRGGGGGLIQVHMRRSEQSQLPGRRPALRVQVLDNGTGIAKDVLPRMFEPFFTTKAAGEGTGLGLSVSYGILKAHNGTLWAENRAGGGAAFSFDLPLAAPPSAE